MSYISQGVVAQEKDVRRHKGYFEKEPDTGGQVVTLKKVLRHVGSKSNGTQKGMGYDWSRGEIRGETFDATHNGSCRGIATGKEVKGKGGSQTGGKCCHPIAGTGGKAKGGGLVK